MAAHFDWLQQPIFGEKQKNESPKQRSRPLPLRMRTYSVAGLWSPGFDENREGVHARNKSLSVAHDFSPTTSTEEGQEDSSDEKTSLENNHEEGNPISPLTSIPSERSSLDLEGPVEVLEFDFSKIDYELERAKVLGQGLWSTVYLAEQKRTTSNTPSPTSKSKTRRWTRHSRNTSSPTLFAVKLPTRPDAKEILHAEALILTTLHCRFPSTASNHIVDFYGQDPRNDALVSEAVLGGSLENLNARLNVLPEVQRHLELISVFPGVAYDLITGLAWLHSRAGVVHADIKPANILLDISLSSSQEAQPVIRARYIDFSASFFPSLIPPDSNKNSIGGGGTWDYLAPEQLRLQPPSFESDIWSLGITLLYVLVGDSPYTAACGGNLFLLREAVKTGDPLQFARMEGSGTVRKRLGATQDFVDICRQGLKKEKEKRVDAVGWGRWLEEFGD